MSRARVQLEQRQHVGSWVHIAFPPFPPCLPTYSHTCRTACCGCCLPCFAALLLVIVVTCLQQDFPTDVDFKWAQDSYNVTQRNTDTWVFFAVFRTRLWLLEQKWSYPGGFTGSRMLFVEYIMLYVLLSRGATVLVHTSPGLLCKRLVTLVATMTASCCMVSWIV